MRNLLFACSFMVIFSCGGEAKKILAKPVHGRSGKSANNPSSFPKLQNDSSYILSASHKQNMIFGYFNEDQTLDTAKIVRHLINGTHAIMILYGNKKGVDLIKSGRDAGLDDDEDFSWVELFEVVKKGSKVWNNVINGEIVSEGQVPEHEKVTLKTDGIYMHLEESCGGGIILYRNGKYKWIQQD